MKNIYRDFYSKIDQRLIRRQILRYDERVSASSYYEFLDAIKSMPTRLWKIRDYYNGVCLTIRWKRPGMRRDLPIKLYDVDAV